MIYSQPVAHEIPLIERPSLFIIGSLDHNAPGRTMAPPELQPKMGQNTGLAAAFVRQMPNAQLEVIDGVGHIAHLEAEEQFNRAVREFLGK